MIKHQTPFTGAQIDLGLRKSLSRRVGALHFSDNSTETPIALAQTYYPVTIAAELDNNGGWSGTNSRLAFTADAEGVFLVLVQMTITAPSANEQVRARIGINGVSLQKTSARSSVVGNPASGREVTFLMHTIATLEQDDFIEAFVGNWTDDANLTLHNLQITAIEL